MMQSARKSMGPILGCWQVGYARKGKEERQEEQRQRGIVSRRPLRYQSKQAHYKTSSPYLVYSRFSSNTSP